MKMSRGASYAIQTLVALAQQTDNVPCSSSKLAKECKLPGRFLLQILRRLVEAGMLESIRGFDGGYQLARPPSQMSLLSIIEAVDGPLSCKLPRVGVWPEFAAEVLRTWLQEATQVERQILSRITLADLGGSRSPTSANPSSPTSIQEHQIAHRGVPAPHQAQGHDWGAAQRDSPVSDETRTTE